MPLRRKLCTEQQRHELRPMFEIKNSRLLIIFAPIAADGAISQLVHGAAFAARQHQQFR